MEEQPSEKKRRLNVSENGAWVFVGNLPLPSTFTVIPEVFIQWIDAAIRDRVTEADDAARVASGEDPIEPAHKFVAAMEHFSSEEGFCFLKLKCIADTFLALRVSGCSYKGYQLSVTLPQCLPEPVYMCLSTGDPSPPPSPLQYVTNWRGKFIVFAEMPHNTTETDIRFLFEALGGPLHTLFMYKDNGFFKGCGRIALVNSLVNDSVVQRLNGASIGTNILRITNLLPDNRPKQPGTMFPGGLSLEEFNNSTEGPTLSVSAQLLSDPVVALQMRSGRNMGECPSRIVQLLNIVKIEDLLCDDLHKELLEDVRKEGSKFGKLESVVAPLPDREGSIDSSTGCGKIFLEYSDLTAARKAQFELNGRLFDNRVACASFYPLLAFQLKQYSMLVP